MKMDFLGNPTGDGCVDPTYMATVEVKSKKCAKPPDYHNSEATVFFSENITISQIGLNSMSTLIENGKFAEKCRGRRASSVISETSTRGDSVLTRSTESVMSAYTLNAAESYAESSDCSRNYSVSKGKVGSHDNFGDCAKISNNERTLKSNENMFNGQMNGSVTLSTNNLHQRYSATDRNIFRSRCDESDTQDVSSSIRLQVFEKLKRQHQNLEEEALKERDRLEQENDQMQQELRELRRQLRSRGEDTQYYQSILQTREAELNRILNDLEISRRKEVQLKVERENAKRELELLQKELGDAELTARSQRRDADLEWAKRLKEEKDSYCKDLEGFAKEKKMFTELTKKLHEEVIFLRANMRAEHFHSSDSDSASCCTASPMSAKSDEPLVSTPKIGKRTYRLPPPLSGSKIYLSSGREISQGDNAIQIDNGNRIYDNKTLGSQLEADIPMSLAEELSQSENIEEKFKNESSKIISIPVKQHDVNGVNLKICEAKSEQEHVEPNFYSNSDDINDCFHHQISVIQKFVKFIITPLQCPRREKQRTMSG